MTSLRPAFGEAITSEDVSLIPVARVNVGATSHGSRRVVGVKVKPLGAFVVSAGVVQWMPITPRRRIVVAGLGILAIVLLLAARFAWFEILAVRRSRSTVGTSLGPD